MRDERFNAENFGDCPTWLIFEALEFIGKQETQRHNIEARTNALGWSGIFGAFGGKVDFVELLPFPNATKSNEVKNELLSKETIAAIKRLVKLDKIPRHVLLTFGQMSENVAKLLD